MRALLLSVSLAAAAVAAGGACAQADRYGPDRAPDPGEQAAVATLEGRYLSWPGKESPASDVPVIPAPPSDQAAAPPPPPAPPPQPAAADGPPPPEAAAPQPAVASLPAAQPVAPPQPQPMPIEPTPPPQVAQQPQSASTQGAADAPHQTAEDAGHAHLPPHIYSVARDYGLRPDPVPLPQQFFSDQGSADLATPPGPLPPHPVPGPQTTNNPNRANTPSNRARAIAQDLPDPDTADPTD